MGGGLSKALRLAECKHVLQQLSGGTTVHLLLVGLYYAGKTTLLYSWGAPNTVIPTIGWTSEQLQHKNVEIISWDLGGASKIRVIWRYYFERIGFHGIIFMVDSTDRERLAEAKNELHRLLQEEGLRARPLLVLANKQDLPYALDAGAVADALGMHHMRTRPWHVQACCATNGMGLRDGLEWLSRAVAAQRRAAPVAGGAASRASAAAQVESSALPGLGSTCQTSTMPI